MKSLDTQIKYLLGKLDIAGFAPPEDIIFIPEDDSQCVGEFSDLTEPIAECSKETKEAVVAFCEELLAIKDRRLYDFSVNKVLTLELGAPAESHFVETAKDEDGQILNVEYIIALPSGRDESMFNSFAHEAGHNLDIAHFPKGSRLEEVAIHSGSDMFQLCFEQDCRSYPDGLGNMINGVLEKRNYTLEELEKGGRNQELAASRFHEERFATLLELFSTGKPLPPSPLLEAYYHMFVDLDLAIGVSSESDKNMNKMRKALANALRQPYTSKTMTQFDEVKTKLDAGGAQVKKLLAPKLDDARNSMETALVEKMDALRQGVENKIGISSGFEPARAAAGRGR